MQKLSEKSVFQNYQILEFKLLLEYVEKGIRIGYRISIVICFVILALNELVIREPLAFSYILDGSV